LNALKANYRDLQAQIKQARRMTTGRLGCGKDCSYAKISL
jgi:hypothetical protein